MIDAKGGFISMWDLFVDSMDVIINELNKELVA